MNDRHDPRLIGQATRTERFAVLQAVADQLISQLARDYAVDLGVGLDLDPELGRTGNGERLLRLIPAAGDGAPVTVLFTSFPGLYVRFGRWMVEAFPACGCDYCNDDPDEVARAFREKVHVLVAGGFAEKPGFASFQAANWSQSGDVVSSTAPDGLPEVPSIGWGAWVPRPPEHMVDDCRR